MYCVQPVTPMKLAANGAPAALHEIMRDRPVRGPLVAKAGGVGGFKESNPTCCAESSTPQNAAANEHANVSISAVYAGGGGQNPLGF